MIIYKKCTVQFYIETKYKYSRLILWIKFLFSFLTHHNVVPVDGDVGVSVRSVHLVHEAEGVKELVNNHLDNDNDDNNNNLN